MTSDSLTSGTVRDAVLSLFTQLGISTIFGNPGSTELPLFRDFPKRFRYVLGLQESLVVAMADGFAQTTRNAAVVNLHSAVGVGHALGNIFTAHKNQTPLVITAGQQARSILPLEPFLFAAQATELPKPYVKWSCEPARAEDVPAAIARAYYVAMQPPCGPTFVSIPVDDWDRHCEPIQARQVSRTVRGDATLILSIVAALDKAKSPAFVVGAGVARDDAWDEIIALAERHQARVWVSPMSGRNSFPENHSLFAGFLPANREMIVSSLTGSDVIVVFGAPVFTYHVEGFGPHIPTGATLYHLSDDPAATTWAPTGVSVVTSLRAGIRDLMGGPSSLRRPSPPPVVRPGPVTGEELTDRYVLQQIAALRPPGSVIVEEAPSSRVPMHDHLPIVERDSFYTCASGGLGYGLPAAVGVALGRPKARTIAVLGDGSSMYSIQGLWTAARLKLPIAFVVLNNERYEALIQFGRHFGLAETVGTALPEIDFCSLARGQGCKAVRITDADHLNDALPRAFKEEGPVLLDVRIQ